MSRQGTGIRHLIGAMPWPADLIRLRTRAPEITISHGDTALVMGIDGAITPHSDGHGLFVRETRVLCEHRFLIDGQPVIPVSHSAVRQDRWLGYFIVQAPGGEDKEGDSREQIASQDPLELRVIRTVGDGMHEDLLLSNYSGRAVRASLAVQVDADFLGTDEVHGGSRRGRTRRRIVQTARGWECQWDHRAHGTSRGSGEPRVLHRRLMLRARSHSDAWLEGDCLRFDIELEAGGQWQACLEWAVDIEDEPLRPPPCVRDTHGEEMARSHPRFLDRASAFHSPESTSAASWLIPALERSRRDLLGLRLNRLDIDEDNWTVAAGVPAYMALFGRDVLTAGVQSAVLGPEILAGSLEVMKRCQGTQRDDWRDEMPGRMLHEARVDPPATLEERPTGRYYGALTSAGLYALGVAELWRWTGDRERTQAWIEPAMAALRWLDTGTRQVAGIFHAITTRSPQGLPNQTWKDSTESVVDADGRIVEQPVASCEEQGIAYLGQCELANVLEAFDRHDDARELRRQARELKARFNDAFWLEDEGYLAMALDPRGKPVRSLGSNALRCLASGIVDESLATRMTERSFQPDLFSGWGMRTLSAAHPAFNPYGYHRGTVWPVEHGPFAIGLRRYGLREHMWKICRAQMELLRLFEGYRLPECVAGHPRDDAHPFPAVYPMANAPQAWSAGTPLLLMQALLGLQPQAESNTLRVDPWLPEWLPQISIRGLRVGAAKVDLRFWRDMDGKSHYAVVDCEGTLRVERREQDWDLGLGR